MSKYFEKIKDSKFLGGSFVVALGSLIAGALNYLFYLIIGRMVDIKTYGEVISIISIFQMASFPAGVLSIIAIWYAAKDKANSDFHQAYENLKSFSLKLSKFGIPILIIFLLATPLFLNFLKIENRWTLDLIWLAALFSLFLGWAGGIINGLQKFKEGSYVNVFGAFVKVLLGIILVKIGWGAAGVSASLLFSVLLAFLAVFIIIRFLSKSPVVEIKTENASQAGIINTKKYVRFALVGFLFFNILSNADMIWAKHSLGAEEAGYYGALLTAAKAIVFITGAIATVFFSISSEENYKKKNSDKLFWQAAGLTSAICFFFSFFYFLFPEFILALFFGQTYLASAFYLPWFAILASSFSLAYLIFFYFLSKERFKELMAISLIPIAEVAFLYLFGHNIASIVRIAAITQAVFFLAGIAFILRKKNQEG